MPSIPSTADLPRTLRTVGLHHLGRTVSDLSAAIESRQRFLAVETGARTVYLEGPQAVNGGPNRGARAVYLRVPPDDASVELFQMASA